MKLKAKCRRVLCFMLALMMLLPAMNASAVNFKPISSIDKDGKPVDLKLRSKACIIVDMETGDSIYNMNGDKELPIATMNMLMTSLLIVEKYQDDLKEACKQLIIAANTNGGPDNVTALLAKVVY